MAVEMVDWLLRSTWALAVAVAAVLLLRPLWRRWMGAGAVLWLYLLLPAALLATSLPGPRNVVHAPTLVATLQPELSGQSTAEKGQQPGSPEASLPMPAGMRKSAVLTALAAWGVGVLLLASWLLVQQLRFRRRLGRLHQREAGLWQSSASDIGPVVIGLLQPRIIVPADFEQRYDAQQRELVLTHERVHLRRGDLPVNALACVGRCLFWFNPLVHLAAAKLRLDQELACDAAVLARHPRAGRAYATALLNTQLADLGLPVGCAWQSSHPLTWRISMLKNPLPGPARFFVGAVLAGLASSATATALWQQRPATAVTVPMPLATTAGSALPLPLPVSEPTVTLVPGANPGSDAADYQPPRVRLAKPARLPPMHGISGDRMVLRGMIMRVSLDARGVPVDAQVHESTLTHNFRRSALDAIKDWRFEPARRAGQAQAATVLVPMWFEGKLPRFSITFDSPDQPQLRKPGQPKPVDAP